MSTFFILMLMLCATIQCGIPGRRSAIFMKRLRSHSKACDAEDNFTVCEQTLLSWPREPSKLKCDVPSTFKASGLFMEYQNRGKRGKQSEDKFRGKLWKWVGKIFSDEAPKLDPIEYVKGAWKGSSQQGISEAKIGDTLDHPCSVGSSRMDFAFLVTFKLLSVVLGVWEVKIKGGTWNSDSVKANIRQLLMYMFGGFAEGYWGRLQKKASKLVGLVVYPDRIYKCCLSKPQNVSQHPFGLKLECEETKDLRTMEWVLREYVKEMKDLIVSSIVPQSQVYWPWDWSVVNFEFEHPEKQELIAPNFGFVFKTTFPCIKKLLDGVGHARYTVFPSLQLPEEGTVFIKYLWSYLYIKCSSCTNVIVALLRQEQLMAEVARSNAEKEKAKADVARSNAEKEKANAEVARLLDIIKAAGLDVENLRGGGGLGIKHPYICHINIDGRHDLLLMRDEGTLLTRCLFDKSFQDAWKVPKIRSNFKEDVGYSALNLVLQIQYCHNDIRLPNIVFRDDNFCLIDFDFARCKFEPKCCRLTERTESMEIAMLKFSVGQIALVVFALDTYLPPCFNQPEEYDVPKWRDYWLSQDMMLTSPNDPQFNHWLNRKGKVVLEFFDMSRKPSNDPQYYFSVLDHLLR